MNKTSFALLISLSLVGVSVFAADDESKKPTIKKCQDATGKWHYGDSASDACAESKITVMSEQGIKKKEIAAPLTRDELKQRELAEEDRAKAAEQSKQDELLLG